MCTSDLTMVANSSSTQANQINMTQPCKVCSEPAAGFHFGAFTCEGCKSFFGRTYNNLTSLNECKNNGQCVINKKTRTSCKSCRLRKCFYVGMSKSGSRYGRRSNWFKIHYLMSNNRNEDSTRSSSAFTNYPSPNRDSRHSESPIEERSKSVPIKTPPYKSPNSLHNLNGKSHLSLLDHLSHHSSMSAERKSPEIKPSTSPKSPSPQNTPELAPKDFLSLYSQFNRLNGAINPFLNSAALTQGLLYPYYPNLLSLYSQSHYLSALQGKRSPPAPDSRNEDFQRPIKMRKTSPPPHSFSPISSNWVSKFPPTPPMGDQSFSQDNPKRSLSPDPTQDVPIDLRIQTKLFEMCSKPNPELPSEESQTDNVSSDVKDYQPLDLSSFKS